MGVMQSLGIDTIVNLITRMGTSADKGTYNQYLFSAMNQAQLEAAYRSDWVARKIVDIPPNDATRAWRNWQAEDKPIEDIEAEEKRLGVQRKVRLAFQRARLYGGAALVLGVGDGGSDLPLEIDRVGKGDLKYLHVLSRHELTAGTVNTNVMDPLYGEPESYEVRSSQFGLAKIHPSRVIRFVGNAVPNIQAAGTDGWGDTVLQVLDDAIKQMGVTTQAIANLLQEAKVDVIKIPQLSNLISSQGYQDNLTTRFTYAGFAKSSLGFLLMDKEEEWQRVNQDFTQLPELMRTFMLVVSGAADIPATRMFGQSPQGLNATGDGDLVNYYDRISSEQTNELSPALERLDEVLIRSATGSRDESIYYEWAELYQLDETQKADIFVKKTTAIEKLATNALVPDKALAKATQNMLVEDGVLPGLEAALEEFPEEDQPEDNPELIGADPLAVDPLPQQRAPGEASPKPTAAVLARLKAALGVDKRFVADARPRTLYVRRNVLNGDDVVRWAKAQGFSTTLPAADMHVTIAFSRAPVDWMKVGQDDYASNEKSQLVIPPGGPRLVERLGRASVLMFVSSWLSWRHESIRMCGASWDFEEYQPHVTISYAAGIVLDDMEPYSGEISLGPEIFEEVSEDWMAKITEDKEWRPT